jgi:DNA modification methylase
MEKGEIIQLGKHRLMCGDCTDKENVIKLMNGDKAKMIFTDPPFNVAYKGRRIQKRKEIANDNLSEEDFKILLDKAFSNAAEVSEKGCMTYVVMGFAHFKKLWDCMKNNGYHWSTTLIWAKNSFVISWADYHNQYEPMWYGWLKGANRLHPLKDRKQSNLWTIKRPICSKLHPTMKPVDLITRAINNSTNEGDIVLDMFGGSGSTLEAAEKTGRTCYIIEIDPEYCEIIKQRYNDIKK